MRTPMPNCDFNKVAKQLRAKSHAIFCLGPIGPYEISIMEQFMEN